jgi:glycolate oxidase FAD binding subunit
MSSSGPSSSGQGSRLQPLNVADLVATLKRAASAAQVIGVRGAGTKLGQGNPPTALDLTVDTTRMNRIVEHAAGDLVVTAQAGVTLEALQDKVSAAGQWLGLDPPEPGATVGGVVATAASGPRRLLYGTPRDLLIGITVVLADGTLAKSGGKVVKNVAGYDLGKLYTGSFGTLGVIAECTFRLHPRPQASRYVVAPAHDPGTAVLAVKRSGAVPSAIEYDGSSLVVLVEGAESAARTQADDIAASIHGAVQDFGPPGFGQHPWTADQFGLKVTHRLGGLDDALAAIDRRLKAVTIRAHAGSGVVRVGYTGRVEAIEELRCDIAELAGSVVIVNVPPDQVGAADVWGPVSGLEVMRRIKDQFDPEHRMSPGRFVGGI